MTGTLTHTHTTYAITGRPIELFAVGVPHQTPAYVARPEEHPPIEEDGDVTIAGDHDLSGTHLVEDLDDASRLLQFTTGGGSQARHQAARIAALVMSELLDQGVLTDEYDLRDPLAASDLDDLCERLDGWAEAIAYTEVDDYPCDVRSLPTWGPQIDDTREIWSWDAERVLIAGEEIAVGHSRWAIVSREEAAERL
jgi:hypothetical protein